MDACFTGNPFAYTRADLNLRKLNAKEKRST